MFEKNDNLQEYLEISLPVNFNTISKIIFLMVFNGHIRFPELLN